MASEFRDSSASGCGGGWADISVILEWSDPDGRRRHYNCALAKPRTIQWVVDDWERSVGVAVPSGAVAYVSERGAPCAPCPRSRLVRESCEVAKALVLSVAWFSTDQDAADVRALLGLAAKSLDARRCFEDATPKDVVPRKLHLVAMVTFKDNHYTAFVKDKHGHWTWHDKAEATACRGWKDVVDRCCKTKGAPMLPYLLLYDNPVEVPPAAR